MYISEVYEKLETIYSRKLLFTDGVNVGTDVKCKIKVVLHKKNYL